MKTRSLRFGLPVFTSFKCFDAKLLSFSQTGSINLLRLPAPTPYAFALSALDVLFTKEELSTSLLFESKKSDKPGLDHQKVEVLLSKSTLLYSYC